MKGRERERDRQMALPNRMSLRPGLLWLTLNLALIIPCLSRNNIYIYINFTCLVICFPDTQVVRVPQVEDHRFKALYFYVHVSSICLLRIQAMRDVQSVQRTTTLSRLMIWNVPRLNRPVHCNDFELSPPPPPTTNRTANA
jgi:hypothetical protein